LGLSFIKVLSFRPSDLNKNSRKQLIQLDHSIANADVS
jgi:hypothetical protein